MEIKKLSLENFRCFEKVELEFGSKMNLILGPNASGKTTILEAIFLLAAGNSFRAEKIAELIYFGKEIARVKVDKLEIVLTTGEVQKKKVPKKKFLINGAAKKKRDFIGQFLAVLFRPEDIRIITGSPSRRRRFFDQVLIQINWEYGRALNNYNKALKRRNKLLEAIQTRKAQKSDLFFWSQSLSENGELIIKGREELVGFINYFWPKGLRFIYQPNKFVFDQNLVREIEQGMTLTGPHRDDFSLEKKGKDLSLFGSRSEQRLAVLNLKLAELEFIEQKCRQRPILLLDDVFSELDEKFRVKVLAIINRQQTIMTTAEPELIKKEFLDKIKKISLS